MPLENLLNHITYRNSPKQRGAFHINSLKRMNLLNQDCIGAIISLRKLRNVLIHDIEIPETDIILKRTRDAQELLGKLEAQFGSEMKNEG